MDLLLIAGMVVQVLTIIGIVVFWQSVKAIPTTIADKLKQDREYDRQRELQVDSFFRETGNTSLQDVMHQWTRYVTDLEHLGKIGTEKGQSEMTELVQKTIGYGSVKTINLLAELFQQIYQKPIKEDAVDASKSGLRLWVLMAMIVASLKKDFTGIEIDPLAIIKIKSNDYQDNRKFFEGVKKEIEKKVG